MMKNILFIAIACFSFVWLPAPDTGTVMGKIKDKTTGDLLPFVSLTLEQEGVIKYKAETDFEGRYKMDKVVPGTYSVQLVVLDYKTKRINGFTVKGKIINFLDVDLEREKPFTKKELKALEKKKRRK